MSDLALRVSGLGKEYRLYRDPNRPTYRTLRGDVMAIPQRWLARLRRREVTSNALWALRDVSFEVNHGEVLGLIGRNGAGKSTLLKILSRIVEPTTGEVDVFGHVGALLEVGTGLYPELTGRENIYLSGALLGMRRHEVKARFDEIVAFAEIEEVIDLPCKNYSTGLYLRLGFSVAAHLDADILLVDEVLSAGDVAFQRKCLARIADVARAGRTVLLVSHNLSVVRALCTSLIVLRNGKIETQTSSLSDALANYVSASGNSNAVWKAGATDGQNRRFVLTEMKITDRDGRAVTAPRHPNDETFVEIAGIVETLDPSLCIGFAVYAEDLQPLFWSYQTDAEGGRGVRLVRGPNRFRAQLPGALFNEGRYRVEFLSALKPMQWIAGPSPDAPAVEFQVEGALGNFPLRTARRPGALAPVLEWEPRE